MRLFDLLARDEIAAPVYAENSEASERFAHSCLPRFGTGEAPVIVVADNVVEYCDSHIDEFAGSPWIKMIQNLAPPATRLWLEGMDSQVWHPPHKIGWALLMVWQDGYLSPSIFADSKSTNATGARWLLDCQIFGALDGALAPFAYAQFAVAPTGEPLAVSWGPLDYPSRYADVWDDVSRRVFGEVGKRLLAIQFMHCKNVALQDRTASRHERRQARREGKPAPVTYKVLDIEPMRRVLRTEGQIETVGLRKALHKCRGHFATYDERPLFGKHRGTFWVPAHDRGTPERGVIHKDYRVHPPR